MAKEWLCQPGPFLPSASLRETVRRLPSWSPQSHIFRLITAHLRAVVWGTGLINKAELGVVTLPSRLALPACCVIGQNPP